MKKMFFLLTAMLLLFSGCKSTDPADYTFSTLQWYERDPFPDRMNLIPDEPPPPVLSTYDEYCAWIDDTYTGENFIHYDDIAFLGEYYSYEQNNAINDVSTYHNRQYFGIKDDSDVVRKIEITPIPSGWDTESLPEMPEVENYYCVPNLYSNKSSYAYRVGSVHYSYGIPSRKEKPLGSSADLTDVSWTFGGRRIIVYPSGHEITEDSGFFYDLIDPKKAQSAVNKFNAAMLQAYIGNRLVIWAPVYIPILCVAAAVAVYLVIRRKRKKAAVKSAVQETEQKTED